MQTVEEVFQEDGGLVYLQQHIERCGTLHEWAKRSVKHRYPDQYELDVLEEVDTGLQRVLQWWNQPHARTTPTVLEMIQDEAKFHDALYQKGEDQFDIHDMDDNGELDAYGLIVDTLEDIADAAKEKTHSSTPKQVNLYKDVLYDWALELGAETYREGSSDIELVARILYNTIDQKEPTSFISPHGGCIALLSRIVNHFAQCGDEQVLDALMDNPIRAYKTSKVFGEVELHYTSEDL